MLVNALFIKKWQDTVFNNSPSSLGVYISLSFLWQTLRGGGEGYSHTWAW